MAEDLGGLRARAAAIGLTRLDDAQLAELAAGERRLQEVAAKLPRDLAPAVESAHVLRLPLASPGRRS